MIDPQRVYEMALAMKIHFNQNIYDFTKYNGKMKTARNYMKAQGRGKIEGFARRWGGNQIVNFLLANAVNDPSAWFGDYSEDVYLAWKGRNDALKHTLCTDIKRIKDLMSENHKTFENCVTITESKYPNLFRMYLQKVISVETAMILMVGLKLIDRWDSTGYSILETPSYQVERLKLRKYAKFYPVSALIREHKDSIVSLFIEG